MAKVERGDKLVKRAYNRKFCFSTDVDYALFEGVYSNPIRDISIGGVYIQTVHGPSAGDKVQMIFSDYSGMDLVKLSGNVSRRDDEGFAVRFLCESTRELGKLKSYIHNL